MTVDPPVRDDGLCAQCQKPRKHAVWNKYSHEAAIRDPFCSSDCCRAWHANPLPERSIWSLMP